MGTEIPKQFLILKDKPVLMHTIERFYRFDNNTNIFLSLPKTHFDYWEDLCKEYNFSVNHFKVAGGKTRFHSIRNALNLIKSEGLVAVHDGVRPLVSTDSIKRSFEKAEKEGSGITACDIYFSLRKIEGDKSIAVNRTLYKEIQTPQTFDIKNLQDAYKTEYNDSFTDDASVFEAAGHTVKLVKGNRENIKITCPEDLLTAEILIDRVF